MGDLASLEARPISLRGQILTALEADGQLHATMIDWDPTIDNATTGSASDLTTLVKGQENAVVSGRAIRAASRAAGIGSA